MADSPGAPEGWRLWRVAVRPKTLNLSAAPVIVGTALAWAEDASAAWLPALAALLAAALIQAGTNLHNDAADFERGNDRPDRVGPLRVTAAGWATPVQVRSAAKVAFGIAFALGLYLASIGGWPIVAIGLASLAAGWAYSGGPHPVSHTPLGELFVFVFFGLVAVGGSHWLQSGALTAASLLGGAALGLFAAAVLMVNNTRDVAGDTAAGRRTLAAVLGPARSRRIYAHMMLAPFALSPLLAHVVLNRPGAWLAWGAVPWCLTLIRRMAAAEGPALNAVLADTARAGLLYALLLTAGVSLPV
ncbi:MAG: 1,4-dihydroxy-2-naphthoate polyprenyltransferase [Rhodocyclaceae bacterium]|nr:1,4-dihydroxy-2-naphthoate polyprenyltransferase [Rhodocyclaceae bacterium]